MITILRWPLMKGKKSDPFFISQFIQESVQAGAETPEQIINRAKKIVNQIDVDIKNIEIEKIKRSKLLDVIASFEKPIKDKTEDAKTLDFFKLRDPGRCKEICDLLKEHLSLPILSWTSFGSDIVQYNFCIKQLLEADIIARIDDKLICGERFNEYIKFVLRED